MARLLPSCILLAATYLSCRTLLPAFLPAGGLSRRDAILLGTGTAVVAGAEAASADSQGQKTYLLWKYGPAVASLDTLADKGEFKKILKAETKLELLTVYWEKEGRKFKKQSDLVDDILDAAANKDAAKVKQSLAEYKKMDKWTEFLDLPPADAQFVGSIQKGMGGGITEQINPRKNG